MHTVTIPNVTSNSTKTDHDTFSFRRYLPHPALRPYIDYYYIFHVHENRNAELPQTLVPLNHPLLHFSIGTDFKISDLRDQFLPVPKTIISGFQTESTKFLPSSGVITIGIFFRPQGMKELLNIPMDSLTNRGFDARDILGNPVWYVYEKLVEETIISNKIKIIDSYLMTFLNDQQINDNLISHILYTMYDQRGLLSIQDLSKQFQISRQHLYRLFNRSLGLSPKVFGRLLRFHHLLNLIKTQPQSGWHDILYNSGFYDQAHMIREYTSIMGHPPTSVIDHNLSVSDFYIQA